MVWSMKHTVSDTVHTEERNNIIKVVTGEIFDHSWEMVSIITCFYGSLA